MQSAGSFRQTELDAGTLDVWVVNEEQQFQVTLPGFEEYRRSSESQYRDIRRKLEEPVQNSRRWEHVTLRSRNQVRELMKSLFYSRSSSPLKGASRDGEQVKTNIPLLFTIPEPSKFRCNDNRNMLLSALSDTVSSGGGKGPTSKEAVSLTGS